ncbi:MAG: preprotein translocase subunit SecE [Bacillota bacterium]|nr:preprotein translocase subunit SecE [Bacillota bacterium]
MSATNVNEKKGGFVKYLKNVRSEIKKVVWPTKKELFNYTAVVLVMVLLSAIAIGLFDLVFNSLFQLLA